MKQYSLQIVLVVLLPVSPIGALDNPVVQSKKITATKQVLSSTASNQSEKNQDDRQLGLQYCLEILYGLWGERQRELIAEERSVDPSSVSSDDAARAIKTDAGLPGVSPDIRAVVEDLSNRIGFGFASRAVTSTEFVSGVAEQVLDAAMRDAAHEVYAQSPVFVQVIEFWRKLFADEPNAAAWLDTVQLEGSKILRTVDPDALGTVDTGVLATVRRITGLMKDYSVSVFRQYGKQMLIAAGVVLTAAVAAYFGMKLKGKKSDVPMAPVVLTAAQESVPLFVQEPVARVEEPTKQRFESGTASEEQKEEFRKLGQYTPAQKPQRPREAEDILFGVKKEVAEKEVSTPAAQETKNVSSWLPFTSWGAKKPKAAEGQEEQPGVIGQATQEVSAKVKQELEDWWRSFNLTREATKLLTGIEMPEVSEGPSFGPALPPAVSGPELPPQKEKKITRFDVPKPEETESFGFEPGGYKTALVETKQSPIKPEVDLYALLGLRKEDQPTQSIIKQAYFDLARTLHPDKTGTDSQKAEQFKKIAFAYEILKDAERRTQYDRTGNILAIEAPVRRRMIEAAKEEFEAEQRSEEEFPYMLPDMQRIIRESFDIGTEAVLAVVNDWMRILPEMVQKEQSLFALPATFTRRIKTIQEEHSERADALDTLLKVMQRSASRQQAKVLVEQAFLGKFANISPDVLILLAEQFGYEELGISILTLVDQFMAAFSSVNVDSEQNDIEEEIKKIGEQNATFKQSIEWLIFCLAIRESREKVELLIRKYFPNPQESNRAFLKLSLDKQSRILQEIHRAQANILPIAAVEPEQVTKESSGMITQSKTSGLASALRRASRSGFGSSVHAFTAVPSGVSKKVVPSVGLLPSKVSEQSEQEEID